MSSVGGGGGCFIKPMQGLGFGQGGDKFEVNIMFGRRSALIRYERRLFSPFRYRWDVGGDIARRSDEACMYPNKKSSLFFFNFHEEGYNEIREGENGGTKRKGQGLSCTQSQLLGGPMILV